MRALARSSCASFWWEFGSVITRNWPYEICAPPYIACVVVRVIGSAAV
jgi:hypothetical protein